MSPQNGRRGYCAKYIPVPTPNQSFGQKVVPVHYTGIKMKKIYLDEPAKWKTRILRQIQTPNHRFGQKVVPGQHYTGIQCAGTTFCPILTRSAVFIWRNILVFHFAGSSIYISFIYDTPPLDSGRPVHIGNHFILSFITKIIT